MAAGLLTGLHAYAAEWKPSLSVGVTANLSDNPRLLPPNEAKPDLILSVSPSIGVDRAGARLKVRGRYTPNFITYVAGTASSEIRNTLIGNASLEAAENFFFIDARASIIQTFASPFGPQPSDLGTSTVNRAEVATLGLSPYVRGQLPGGSQYLVRGDVAYTTSLSGNQQGILGKAVSAKWDGVSGTLVVPAAEYNLFSTQFGSQQPFVSQTGRLRATVNLDPEFQVFATGGYEKNDFVLIQQAGPIYGGGFNWKPSPRTSVRASVENRFFGNTYDFDAQYRTALTAWTLRAARRLQTSQQQIAQASASASGTRDALDALLGASIPDPVERAATIDRILAQSGLGGPTPLFSPRVLLVESFEPSIAILGTRTTVTFGVFWRRTTPLTDAVATSGTDVFNNLSTITQRGGSITASHKLDPMLTADASVARIFTIGQPTTSGGTGLESWQSTFRAGLTRRIDANTFGTIGIRSQIFNSTSFSDYRERAVLVSITHLFF